MEVLQDHSTQFKNFPNEKGFLCTKAWRYSSMMRFKTSVCQSVCGWYTKLMFSATRPKQLLPKSTDEQRTTIRKEAFEHSMEFSDDVHKKERNSVRSMMRWKHPQLNPFQKTIHNHKDSGMVVICRQAHNKIQSDLSMAGTELVMDKANPLLFWFHTLYVDNRHKLLQSVWHPVESRTNWSSRGSVQEFLLFPCAYLWEMNETLLIECEWMVILEVDKCDRLSWWNIG